MRRLSLLQARDLITVLMLLTVIALLLVEIARPEPAPSEPIVVVCTWGHGCQQTDEPQP